MARQLLGACRESVAACVEHREYSVLPRNVVELANKRLIVLGLGGSAYINSK